MLKTIPLTLVTALCFFGTPTRAAGDVIWLLYDHVQLAAHAQYTDPSTGEIIVSNASFDGSGGGVPHHAEALGIDNIGSAHYVPSGHGFDLSATSYPGDCNIWSEPCPDENTEVQTASGRVDWVFRVDGESTWAYIDLDAYNAEPELTSISLYDLTRQMFVTDYHGAVERAVNGEFQLENGHNYWLTGIVGVPSSQGDPMTRVGFSTNANVASPPVPEPMSMGSVPSSGVNRARLS